MKVLCCFYSLTGTTFYYLDKQYNMYDFQILEYK